MIRLLLPLLMALIGTAAGVATGLTLGPGTSAPDAAEPAADSGPEPETPAPESAKGDAPAEEGLEYVKLNNQFVIPLVSRDLVSAMIVLSLTIEIAPGTSQLVYDREPKLRDAVLQVLFDHANMGGFDGTFTDASSMDVLRRALTEAARRILGPAARGILITDIARQDL